MMRTLSEREVLFSSLRFEWKVDDVHRSGFLESGIFHFFGFQWKLSLEKSTCKRCRIRFCVSLIMIDPPEGNGRLSIQSFMEDAYKKSWFSNVEYFDTSTESSKRVLDTGAICPFLEVRKNGLISEAPAAFVFILTSGEDQPVKIKEGRDVQACMNAESEASVERYPSAVVDYRRLFADGTLSDVTLKIGDITIPAHRLILSSHSTFFYSMLRRDMEESRGRIVEISDVDPQVLFHLLQFIYSGELPDLTMETASKLFVAGDKYGVEALKNQCSAFMKEKLTEGNACGILVLADAHGDKDLRELTISFIMDTALTLKDDVWLGFCDEHPKLANEVLNRALKAAKRSK